MTTCKASTVRLVEPEESHMHRRVPVKQGRDHYVRLIGGSTMHGPKQRSHAFKPNKKVRRLGLKIALSTRAAEGKLLVFYDLEVPTHKTKNSVSCANMMENSKKMLVVDGDSIIEKLKLATQNVHYVNVLPS
ncbi:50S ribosomal protein L4, partial [Bienertia sinuspersici]